MGLWSKGYIRSMTGEIRLEEDMNNYVRLIYSFLHRFFQTRSTVKVELAGEILYVLIGQYGGRATLKERSHTGMMRCLLQCVDNILIHTRDVQVLFLLRDKIQRNLDFYKKTHVLKDLYFV